MFWLIANWKMNVSTAQQAQELICGYKTPPTDVSLVICPPYPFLGLVQDHAQRALNAISLGAQDCSRHIQGAFTGDVSATMLKDSGCTYVLIGHSERRTHHQETNAGLLDKMNCAHNAGLIPILCIGELSLQSSIQTLRGQVDILKEYPAHAPIMIAYEPLWAIGTGQIPTPQHIQTAFDTIHAWFGTHARSVPPLLYGGSVNASNAPALRPICQGFLVGNASLDADGFNALMQYS